MLCDRQKPATPFNVAPIRALLVLARVLFRKAPVPNNWWESSGVPAAKHDICWLGRWTPAGDICTAAFHPLPCRGTCVARRPLRAARQCARVVLSAGLQCVATGAAAAAAASAHTQEWFLLCEYTRSHMWQSYERGAFFLPPADADNKQLMASTSAAPWRLCGVGAFVIHTPHTPLRGGGPALLRECDRICPGSSNSVIHLCASILVVFIYSIFSILFYFILFGIVSVCVCVLLCARMCVKIFQK